MREIGSRRLWHVGEKIDVLCCYPDPDYGFVRVRVIAIWRKNIGERIPHVRCCYPDLDSVPHWLGSWPMQLDRLRVGYEI